MSLATDGSGVDLVLDTTPVVTFTSLSGLQTNDAKLGSLTERSIRGLIRTPSAPPYR